jgi:hypothetical protein
MDITISSLAGIALATASLGFLFTRVVLEVRQVLKAAHNEAAGASTWPR